MSNSVRGLLPALFLVLAILPATAGAPDPFEGTWELDLAKSTFKPGPSAFKTQTRVISNVPDGIHQTVDALLQNDGTFSGSGTYKLDGRDYPFKGVPGLDTIALTRTSDLVQTGVTKLNGQVTMRVSFSVSADHRELTVHAVTVEGSARPFDNTLVFNRK